MSFTPRIRGIILLAAFPVLLIVAIIRPANPFDETITVRAQFDNAPSLSYGRIDRDVRMDGVNVGEIGELTPAEGSDDAIVELKLEKEKAGKIGRDAAAHVRPHTAFDGSSYIELDPGSESAPPLGDRVIPPSRTRDYVSVDETLRVAPPNTRQALKDDVRDLDVALGGRVTQSLQRSIRNFPSLLSDGAVAGRAAQGRSGDELRGVIRGLSATTESLASRERDLAPLLRQGGRTFDALNTDSGASLDAVLVEAPPTLERLVSGSRELRRILDHLEPLSADLRPAVVQAAPALRELRPLLRELRPIARDAGPFVDDLRVALARGEKSAGPARALLSDVQPALVRLDDLVLPKLHESSTTAVMPGRRRSRAPADLAPAPDVPVYQLLFRGVTESGSGSLSTVVTPEQSARAPGNMGVGHAFRFGAALFPGVGSGEGQPPCSDLTGAVRSVADQTGLCTPDPGGSP